MNIDKGYCWKSDGDVLEIHSFDNKSDKVLKLKKDILIPAGTEFKTAPTKIKLNGDKHFQSVFGLSPDSAGFVRYCTDGMDNFDEWFEEIE